jgi:phospholipid/cholesterol/gamma-HCH transport system substrate-binding protein
MSKESKVGILAAVAITILILGYNFMRGKNVFTSTQKYYAVYENLDNLLPSNPVLINGYRVGQVYAVQLNENTRKPSISISLPKRIKIPNNSILKIINLDMIGTKAVEIVFGDSKTYAQNGDTLSGEIQASLSAILDPLTKKVNSILGEVDSSLNAEDISGAVAELGETLKAYKETAGRLNNLLAASDPKINATLNNLEKMSKDLKGLSPKIDGILKDINKTVANISKADFEKLTSSIQTTLDDVKKIAAAINESKGSAGLLVNSTEVHDKLESSLKQLESLLIDIEKNPRRYTGITERQRKKGDKMKE